MATIYLMSVSLLHNRDGNCGYSAWDENGNTSLQKEDDGDVCKIVNVMSRISASGFCLMNAAWLQNDEKSSSFTLKNEGHNHQL